MLSAAAYPVVLFGGWHLPATAAERPPAYAALGRAFLSCFRVLRAGAVARRGGAVSRTRAARRSVRDNGVCGGDLRGGRARQVRTPRGLASRSLLNAGAESRRSLERVRWRNWRAAADEDGHYCFAVAL